MNEPLDPPASNDLRIEARAEEVMQEMLEIERSFVEKPFCTDVYDLDDDVALKMYQEHGNELTRLIVLMLQARHIGNKRIKSQKLAEYCVQLMTVEDLAYKHLRKVCEEIAAKEIRE